jgi:hypothetical protein
MKKLIARINNYFKTKREEKEKAKRFAAVVQRSMCCYKGKEKVYDNIKFKFKVCDNN